MIRRNTWVVLIFFIAVLGVAFYLQRNPLPAAKAETTPTVPEMALVLEGWQPADITGLELRSEEGTLTLTQNPDGSWTMNPDPAAASIGQVEALKAELLTVRPLAILSDTQPLDALGLAAPTRSLTLTAAGGKQAVLKIGSLTPTQSGYYAQLDNAAPMILNQYTVNNFYTIGSRSALLPATPTPAAVLPFATATP